MKKIRSKAVIVRPTSKKAARNTFEDVLALIESSRTRAVSAVNTILIDLCWSIGEHISRKISEDGWGKGTVRSWLSLFRSASQIREGTRLVIFGG